ncbi:unnamed protein product [Calicophoron daubneyi]
MQHVCRKDQINNALNYLSFRELRTPRFSELLYKSWIRVHSRRLIPQQVFRAGPIEACLLSPSGQWLFGICEGVAMPFRVFWENVESGQGCHSERSQPRFRARRIYCPRTSHFAEFFGRDLAWRSSSDSLIVLGNCGGMAALETVSFQGSHYASSILRNLPFQAGSVLRFATMSSPKSDMVDNIDRFFSPHTSDCDGFDNDDSLARICSFSDSSTAEPLFILTRDGLYFIGGSTCARIYSLTKSSSKFQRYKSGRIMTACCIASSSIKMNWGCKICSQIRASNVQAYLSSSGDGGCVLELLDLNTCYCDSSVLIRFGVNSAAAVAGVAQKGDGNTDIVSLKCLIDSAGHRSGLLTGRRCGLVQLWDDRWPNRPAVQYYGSDGSLVSPFASHIPPVPAVDSSGHRVVCCPLLASSHIGIWDFDSGEVLNVLKVPYKNPRPPFARPPHLFFRSSWNNLSGTTVRGPALLAVGQESIHCFSV